MIATQPLNTGLGSQKNFPGRHPTALNPQPST